MIRLRDITIRTRLHALVIISTVGLAAVLGLSALVLHWYRVEGPVHKELQLMRELLTEMEPSVLALLRPHLVVEGLPATTDPAAISRQLDELAAMERDYRERYEYWKDSLLDPAIKKAIADCYQPADEYFRLVKDELAPALRSNQIEKAKKLLEEKINPRYAEHQRAFDKALTLIRDIGRRYQAVGQRCGFVLDAGHAGLERRLPWLSVGLLGWLTTRSITQSTEKLIGRVQRNGQRGGRPDGPGGDRRQRRTGPTRRRHQRHDRQDPDRGAASPRGERPVAFDLLARSRRPPSSRKARCRGSPARPRKSPPPCGRSPPPAKRWPRPWRK